MYMIALAKKTQKTPTICKIYLNEAVCMYDSDTETANDKIMVMFYDNLQHSTSL